jgi:hypothetical protein
MEEPNTSKIYKCDCYAEAIEIQKNEENSIELCMWQLGLRPNNFSLKEKFRWIWYILTHDKFWADECILSKETARQLGKDLIELTE